MKFCKLFGHSFRRTRHYYRCRWCGVLRYQLNKVDRTQTNLSKVETQTITSEGVNID